MLGYWRDPAETAKVLRKDGLYTGDLAKVDADGFLYLVSRKKDMIKSGANRISPLEIENVVCGLDGVVECAAVGMPDEILGETIKLFVILNGANLTGKDIMIYCKQNLAIYKQPKEIAIVESLPKTASGKIKREELKKANS
jgi:Acyl-CoA synthetases (AMP-forming)/AMP-acid ligases II